MGRALDTALALNSSLLDLLRAQQAWGIDRCASVVCIFVHIYTYTCINPYMYRSIYSFFL